MFSKNLTNNSQSGFSFIEVMIGVLIVSIAAYGMVVGATHARGELRAIAVKERATEELLSFVESMKGRIADGKLSIIESSGNLQGETIYLFGNQHSQTKLAAKIFYEPVTKLLTDSTSNVDRYLLKSWIEWEDFSTPSRKVVKREDIEMVMMEFPL
ncbi:MAG: prepilin-type N-terminal cleavage/methylation domain-containing protein [Candidatus Neomarinimicrobiota bacterium]|nr:prepilin-type N-terminal cleavage/methylation domain-containing protein [Candidatus Neomarinimicrobiota bacterium]|tara:strand:+ start:1609 stop:2076 length:468 start_codon:yes stop_codon:yes gene_type:complete